MFPSSSRVKLNRVALKDVIGLKLVPRRRRVPGPEKQEDRAACEPASAAVTAPVRGGDEPAHTGATEQTGSERETGNTPGGGPEEETCVDIDRNSHPIPNGFAGSDGSLRRVVRASGCGLCGDCKYISPQQKTLGTQPTVNAEVKQENTVTESPPKIIIWIDQYPKVTLCDVAQKCDGVSDDCAYVLPDVLKTKVVHCFKQDMRTGFRFGPSCLGHNKHETEESALAKNREFCPRVQSEKSVCQSQSLTEHQRHLKKHTDAQTLTSHTKCRFLKSWTTQGSATCSASFLLGKRTKKGECRTGMWDRDVEEDPGAGINLIGAGIRTDKRTKLGDSFKDGILSPTPDLESVTCKDLAKTDSRDKKKTCFWMSDDRQSSSEQAAGGRSSFGSAVKENSVHKKPCGQIDNPTKTDTAQMSSELLCESNEVDTDEVESFTCQRVRAYFRKINFSCARTYLSWPFSNSGLTRTAECADPSPGGNSDSQINQNQPGSSSEQTNGMLPNASTDPSSGTTHQASHQNEEKQEEDGVNILAARNGERHDSMSSYSSDSKNMEFAPHLMEAEESPASRPPDTSILSNPSQRERDPGADTVSALSLPVSRPKADSSMSTPSPSALGLSDWETTTTLSPTSSPFTHGGLSSLSATPSSLPPSSFLLKKSADASSPKCMAKAMGKTFSCDEKTQMTSRSSSSTAPPHNSDSFLSCESSLLLPQYERESDEELVMSRCPPKLEPYYNTSPINREIVVKERSLHNVLTLNCVDTDSSEFMLPPILSPVTTPQGRSWKSFLPQSPGCSEEEEEVVEEEEMINKDTRKHKMLPECHMPQIANGNNENSKEYLEHGSEELEGVSTNFKTLREPQSSPSEHEDVDDNEEECQDETDYEDDVKQVNKKSERVPSDPKTRATLTSGVLTEPCSSPSSDEDDGGAFSDDGQPTSTREEGSSLSRDKAEAAEGTQQGFLDEFTAYEQDVLLVDVIPDDPELFENLPQESLLKLGPTRVSEAPKTRPTGVVTTLSLRTDGAPREFEQRLTPVNIDFHLDSPDVTEESNSRPWRPQCGSTPSKKQSNTCPASERQTKNMGQSDSNNSHVNGGLERSQPIQTVNSLHNHFPPLMTIKNGPRTPNPANMAESRHHKSNSYCRQYFSESLSCGFKMCWFQHVPVEGDEKFCVDTVTRFTKNPMCLQKAGAVFTGYYQNNPPGVYFSMPVLLSLLWALLKAGMVSDIFSVLSASLAHKIVPGHEFLLALFNFVREKSLMGFVPELMQLTFKMASAGLVLSLDSLDCVKNTPESQQTVHPNSPPVSGNHKSSTSAPFPDCLNLAQAIVEIELCTKQEDWRRMGEVFTSICQSSQHPNQVERISGRMAIALLSESKDKLSLPFAAFAETVHQNEGMESLARNFLGRIGVSLMLRYHKTHQWAKGRRVVQVLSISKVNYSTLKGLFGNEDGASRCYLVTVATELFLLSGSVEGALNTLRENKWFLSSSLWPCEPADLESRTRVLIRLAEKTSHRDTLDVLCNLPGLKEPNDLVDISRYIPLFNSQLQVCMDRQILPVASDTVDFMLSRNLAVDQAMLQMLLHKLGKQNLWLRAREVFRHSLSVGYYPDVSAPPGFMALIVPCRLGEVELALTFEMFITVNATAILHQPETTTSCLSITLKRTQSCESEYLSAGSRLLSAACIPQPKLIVHYTAVNSSSQEQVFTLDISSARCWLRHNHLWANEVWTH